MTESKELGETLMMMTQTQEVSTLILYEWAPTNMGEGEGVEGN